MLSIKGEGTSLIEKQETISRTLTDNFEKNKTKTSSENKMNKNGENLNHSAAYRKVNEITSHHKLRSTPSSFAWFFFVLEKWVHWFHKNLSFFQNIC